MKTLSSFEDQHRRLHFRAGRNHDFAAAAYHLEACNVAIGMIRAGEVDATALWEQYPADQTPVDPGQPADTGAQAYISNDTADVDFINDGDDSTPKRYVTIYDPEDEVPV